MQVQLIWEEFLKIIKEEFGSQVVETWFKAVKLDRWDQETRTVFLQMPNQFVSKWVKQHYSTIIKTNLSRLLHTENIKLFFNYKDNTSTKSLIPAAPLQKQILVTSFNQVNKENQNLHNIKKLPLATPSKFPVPRFASKTNSLSKLNEKFTFDSYVVGPNNSLAHAAAFAVAQNPGKAYNPLFIYGGTGLGKTHLMHAIGNEMKRRNELTRVRYETSDQFIHNFINSIRLDRTQQFREKYLKINVLLLDDIQFFSRKEQTQETFFHIFDLLQRQQKQVIFTSDTLPKNITGLQSRIQSRLQSGLVADIHMPTLETKMAILKKKAISHQIALNDEVIRFIASKPATNIRELEGYLIRISAVSSLTSQSISLDLAKQILHQFSTKENKSISIETVAKEVSRNQGISIVDLKSKKRNKDLAFARQIAFYLMKKLTVNSLQAMGKFMGGRDHTTVLHSITKIENIYEKDLNLTQKIRNIEQSLNK